MDDSEKERLIELAAENHLTMIEEPRNKFHLDYSTHKLLNHYFNINEMRVSVNDLMKDYIAIIQDIKNEMSGYDDMEKHWPVDESIDTDGLVAVFESKVSDVIESIMRADLIEFEFYFPWNIFFEGSIPNFSEYDTEVSRLDDDQWQTQIQSFKNDPDIFNAGTIDRLSSSEEYSYWMAKTPARGPDYAFSEVQNTLQLVCSKLTHARHRGDMEYVWDRQRTTRNAVDTNARWSRIRMPFAFLYADHRGPHGCKILDRDGRTAVDLDWSSDGVKPRYNQLPSFDSELNEIDELLHDALMVYQEGISSKQKTEGFFKFWRGLEELSLAGRGNKENVTERVLFGLEIVTQGYYDPLIDEVKDELWSVRNNWVHSSYWKRIFAYHEKLAKYLLDMTIQLYVEELNELDKNLIEDIFRFGIKNEKDVERFERAIAAVDDMRQSDSN
jgi:hypothetical protein